MAKAAALNYPYGSVHGEGAVVFTLTAKDGIEPMLAVVTLLVPTTRISGCAH
jgi:hypothetical protein